MNTCYICGDLIDTRGNGDEPIDTPEGRVVFAHQDCIEGRDKR